MVKGAIIAGFGALAASSAAVGVRYLVDWWNSPARLEEGFVFTSASKPLWYERYIGRAAMVSHFAEQEGEGYGFGATALWRPMVNHRGNVVPGTGSPALIMRLDPSRIIMPADAPEPVTREGFVTVFNTCVHLCCNNALNFSKTLIEAPPPSQDIRLRPNASLSGLPVLAPDIGVIYCPCHSATFDPFRIVWEPDTSGHTHPNHPIRYLGANWVWGPAQRAQPIIPVDIQDGKIIGLNTHPEWYQGYCGLA